MIERRLLEAFVAVAEELHFGRAARRLHISQPPLSMHIRRLETLLGARLFDRTRRSVALTEAGQFLLGRARHLLAESAKAASEVARIAKGEAGVVTVGYTTTATYEVLPPFVRRFRETQTLRLELVEMATPAQKDALEEGRIEVGIACGPVDGVPHRVLAREKMIAVLPKAHPLARRSTVPLAKLAREPMVFVHREVEPAWADATTAAVTRAGHTLDVVQRTDSKIAMLGLVAAGLGCSIASASMQRLPREGVTYRPIAGLDLRVPLVALQRPEPSPRALAVLALLLAAVS